jgi:hypothetical protein
LKESQYRMLCTVAFLKSSFIHIRHENVIFLC